MIIDIIDLKSDFLRRRFFEIKQILCKNRRKVNQNKNVQFNQFELEMRGGNSKEMVVHDPHVGV